MLLQNSDGKVTGRWWLAQSLGSSCCCTIEVGQLSQHLIAFSFPSRESKWAVLEYKYKKLELRQMLSIFAVPSYQTVMWQVLLQYFPISFVALQKAHNFTEKKRRPYVFGCDTRIVSCCPLHEINFIRYNDDILLSVPLMVPACLLRKCISKWVWYL